MNTYLLTMVESVGTRYESTVTALVDATSHGYAKYHWHKLQNQNGSHKQGNHHYENLTLGYSTELESVEKLSETEADVMEGRIPRIPGFNPDR